MNIGTKAGGGITRVGERCFFMLGSHVAQYQSLFFGDGVFADRVDRVAGEFADDPLAQNVVAFVRAGGKRPLMRPNVKRGVEDKEGDAS